MKIDVHDNWLEGDGFRFKGQHPILFADLVGDRVVVIYDWMALKRDAAARNLFCYDKTGQQLWRAPDIGFGPTDAYTTIIAENPLEVGNFAGFSCRIDEETGVVLQATFTK